MFKKSMSNFPTRKGKKFEGFPAHFSTVDPELIRNCLMKVPQYRKYIDEEAEDLLYTIEVRIFALMGGIFSVWVYMGIQKIIEEDPEEEPEEEGDEAKKDAPKA